MPSSHRLAEALITSQHPRASALSDVAHWDARAPRPATISLQLGLLLAILGGWRVGDRLANLCHTHDLMAVSLPCAVPEPLNAGAPGESTASRHSTRPGVPPKAKRK